MQAFAFNIRRDKFKDPRVRRAFNFAFDFEEMNKQIFFGQYKRIASYFEGTELAVDRPAAGPGTRNPQDRARTRCRPDLFTQALHQPGRRRSAGGAQQSARGARAAARGRLRNQEHQARQRQDRRAVQRRIPGRASRPSSASMLFYKPSLERLGIDVSRAHVDSRAIREPAAAMGFRHHHRVAGANRCRPATSSAASGARRPPTSPARATSSASRIRRSTR